GGRPRRGLNPRDDRAVRLYFQLRVIGLKGLRYRIGVSVFDDPAAAFQPLVRAQLSDGDFRVRDEGSAPTLSLRVGASDELLPRAPAANTFRYLNARDLEEAIPLVHAHKRRIPAVGF